MIRYICVLLACLPCLPLFAQTPLPAMSIIGKAKDNRIMLRWGADSPALWLQALKYGYKLERKTIAKDGQMSEAGFVPKLFKTYPKKTIESLEKQDERVAVVTEMVYDSPFQPLQEDESPSKILKKKQELDLYFSSFMLVCDFCPLCAQVAGMAWTDSTAKVGEEYAYQISLAENPRNLAYTPSVVVVKVEANKPLASPRDLQADFRDKQVMLSWSLYLDRGIYSGYWVERSEDGTNFKALDKTPFVFSSEESEPKEAFYLDSLAKNDKIYYYRIKGVTPFGEVSPPSEVASGAGKENVNGEIVIDSAKVKNNEKVILYWHIADDARKKIKGFEIRRSAGGNTPFVKITNRLLSPQETAYIDEPKQNSNYYEVVAIGKSGEPIGRSFPYLAMLEDNTPPLPPQNLTGKIDDKGVAVLTWEKNKETDLRGYRVFRANTPKEEFVEITRYLLENPTYTDTVNIQTLTRFVYYKIVATDISFNPSDYSKPLQLKRPDHIAPSTPVFTHMAVRQDSLKMRWVLSSSDDVSSYTLARQMPPDTTWKTVKTWKVREMPLEWGETSETLELGEAYKYRLAVADSAGNQAHAISPLQYFETGMRPAVTLQKETIDRDKRLIKLAWTYKNVPISRCLIYKATNDNPMTLYETLDGNPNTFEDKQLRINNTYRYQIQLVYKNGTRTQISKVIEVKY